MSLSLQGLERYQTHQQLSHLDTPTKAAEAAKSGETGQAEGLEEDAVSLSDGILILEWIAGKSPNLAASDGKDAANLGRLSDRLLRYDLISVPEAGRLMSLAQPEAESAAAETDQRLTDRILERLAHSESRQERLQWQKLGRLVSTLSAAQQLQ